MFEGSLVESNHLLRTNNRWTTAISLAVQLAVAATLIAVPLLHPEALAFANPTIPLVAPLPKVPPPPQRMRVAAVAAVPNEYAPPTHTRLIQNTSTNVGLPPTDEPISMGPSVGGFKPGDLLASLGSNEPRIVARAESPSPHVGPIHVSLGVAQGLLLAPLHPTYPQIAIVTKTQGTVVVQATISKTGTVEGLQVISGPAMLRNAALDAIREARYSPYKLNGEPVEVETTFNVNFRIGDQ